MPEESATRNLVERSRRAIEAVGRRDFDTAMACYGPDSVWETSALGMGTYRGVAVIRSSLQEWTGIYEELDIAIEEGLDFGNGVILAVARQRGL